MKSSIVVLAGLSILSLTSVADGQWRFQRSRADCPPACVPGVTVSTTAVAPPVVVSSPVLLQSYNAPAPPQELAPAPPVSDGRAELLEQVAAMLAARLSSTAASAPAAGESVQLNAEGRSPAGLSLDSAGKGTVIVITGDHNVVSGFGTAPASAVVPTIGEAVRTAVSSEAAPATAGANPPAPPAEALPAAELARQAALIQSLQAQNDALQTDVEALKRNFEGLRAALLNALQP